MMNTDAGVFPYPAGDSSVRRFALEARALGFDSIVATGVKPSEFEGIAILSGLLFKNLPAREVSNRINREGAAGVIVSALARDNGFNRAICSMRGAHILRGAHAVDRNAFDHVAAKMASDNGTAIDIDLSPIISARGYSRQKAIHRYLDILTLQRRFEFPLTISSNARSILCMRAVQDIFGLCSLIGMDTAEVKQALAGVAMVSETRREAVMVVE